MALEYFGYPSQSGDPSGGGSDSGPSGIATIQQLATGYVCPGSGSYNLTSLGAYTAGGGVSGYIRLALYSDSGNLIVEASAKKQVTNDSIHWEEFTTFTWHSGTQLTGGAGYRLASNRSGLTPLYYRSVTNASKYASSKTYCDNGFPATDADMQVNALSMEWAIRATVEAAAGGGLSIPVAMADYRRFTQ
jgi:hypothetical protein